MKIAILTSDSLRHRYLIETLSKKGQVVGVVTEEKGDYYQTQKEDSLLISWHFEQLLAYEKKYFSTTNCLEVPNMCVERSHINDSKVVDWVSALKPDVIVIFGTAILKDLWLERFPNRIVNMHLGYSPYYRGSATLFWPFVANELERVGVTLHLAVQKVDAGSVLKVITPDVLSSDNYYDITNKAIKAAIDSLPEVLDRYLSGTLMAALPDLSKGRVYKKSDFNERVLRKALDNGHVDYGSM